MKREIEMGGITWNGGALGAGLTMAFGGGGSGRGWEAWWKLL